MVLSQTPFYPGRRLLFRFSHPVLSVDPGIGLVTHCATNRIAPGSARRLTLRSASTSARVLPARVWRVSMQELPSKAWSKRTEAQPIRSMSPVLSQPSAQSASKSGGNPAPGRQRYPTPDPSAQSVTRKASVATACRFLPPSFVVISAGTLTQPSPRRPHALHAARLW